MSLNGGPHGTAWRVVVALTIAAGLVLPGWSATGGAAQPALPETAAAAPASTVLFHAMDLDPEGAGWQQTEALLARVGVPDALAVWEEEILAEGGASGDITQADLDSLLGGEIAIVVTSVAVEQFLAKHMSEMLGEDAAAGGEATPEGRTSDQPFGVAGILVPGDVDGAWAYVDRQLSGLAQKRNVTLEATSEGGVDMLVIPPRERKSRDDAKSDPMDEWAGLFDGKRGRAGIATARAGDFIIVAPTAADVREVVAVIEGDADSLADNADAMAVAAELPADPLSFTYLDGAAIVAALDPAIIERVQAFIPEYPVEALGSRVAATFSADVPGFRFDAIVAPGTPGALDAVSVANDPAVAEAAGEAPAGTFLFQAGRLPETTYLGAPFSVAQLVNAAASGDWDESMSALPTAEEMDAEIAAASTILGFDLRADLFALLGYEFIAYSSFPEISFESFSIDAVAAVSTTDPPALAETAQKLADWIGRSVPEADLSTRDVGGDTVFVLRDPESPEIPAFEFGVVGEQAVVGIGGGIDSLGEDPDGSLADDAQFQTVMGFLPAEYYQIGYIDIGQAIPPLMAIMAGMESGGSTDAAATPEAGGGLENIRALAGVAYQRGEMSGTSVILYIAEP